MKKTTTHQQPLVLLDADIYLHRAAESNETVVEWGDPCETVSIYSDMDKLIQSYEYQASPFYDLGGEVVHCLSWGHNFRKLVDPSYKSNRTKRKPVGFGPLKAWVMENKLTRYVDGLEADDVMGIIATRPMNREVIIVSEDKDLKTIPCRLIRAGVDHITTPNEADYNWMIQTLTGDTTDGYPGCPGIGPKKAEALLHSQDDLEEHWEKVLQAFEKANLTTEDALKQARLARILRNSDFNNETKEVILWTPQ